jgi:hypothetical protein
MLSGVGGRCEPRVRLAPQLVSRGLVTVDLGDPVRELIDQRRPVPLNGTIAGLMPRIELSTRPKLKALEPTPACAMFSLSALAFA